MRNQSIQEMTSRINNSTAWIIILLILAQLVPMNRINPPAPERLPAPDQVKSVLKKNCYDCHSNETRWHRSAFIAPLSWFVVYQIERGRNALNVSVPEKTSGNCMKGSLSRIRDFLLEKSQARHACIPGYPDGTLSASNRRLLIDWIESKGKNITP
jgi:hypothetical protein